jgi:4-hydroxy-2-oxoheptanedioate aldolase
VRKNTLKARLRAGERVVGVRLPVNNPELVELFGHLGFDFINIDAQHGGVSLPEARSLMRAAELTGMTTVVRVPRNAPDIILEYLDAGASGIIVPDVNSKADAEAAVRSIKYPPIGNRGAFAGSRASFYGTQGPASEYFRKANEETMVCTLLEDRVVLDRLPEIMSVDGIDVVFIGPSDLALTMGVIGGWNEPAVQTAVDKIAAAAVAANKPYAMVALTPEDGRRLIDQGCRMLTVAAGDLIANAARAFLQALRA